MASTGAGLSLSCSLRVSVLSLALTRSHTRARKAFRANTHKSHHVDCPISSGVATSSPLTSLALADLDLSGRSNIDAGETTRGLKAPGTAFRSTKRWSYQIRLSGALEALPRVSYENIVCLLNRTYHSSSLSLEHPPPHITCAKA